MRVLRTFAVFCVLGLALAGTAGADSPTVGKATGSGSVAENPDSTFTPFKFRFTAQGISVGTDATPKGEVQFSNPAGSFHGDVECYFQSGNEAFFSGLIEQSTGEFVPPVPDGFTASYAAHAVDNGNGATPDQIGFNSTVAPIGLDCFSAAFQSDPVAQGSIQVHPIG